MEFRLDDDHVLHFQDVCLYRSPCDMATPSTTLECLGALARRSILSMVDVNGLCNRCHINALSSLDAICILVHRGHSVRIDVEAVPDEIVVTDETYHIPVHTRWSIASLLMDAHIDMVDCEQSVCPRPASDRFAILVSHTDLGVPLVVREDLFHTVITSPTYVLRVSHNEQQEEERRDGRVARYTDRILTHVEMLPPNAPCGILLVDERGRFDSYTGGVTAERLKPLTSVLLRTEMIPIVTNSEILRGLMDRLASRWNSLMRDMWSSGTHESLFTHLRFSSTPDAIARCIDPMVIASMTMKNERIDVLGMSLMRRMMCCDATRYAEMRTSMFKHHGIVRFDVIPMARSRFEHLYGIGVFEGMTACRGAMIVGTDHLVVCVPVDAKVVHVTESIATLLTGSSRLSGDRPQECFSFGIVYQESSSQCDVSENLIAYHLVPEVMTRTLRFMEAEEEERFECDETVLSVDELERMTIPCDPSRTRRREVAILFPEMAKRVELKSSNDTSACLRELQSRRVVREWSLDGIDAGRNMSSLGLCIILHLLLSQWLGARCRIAQSRTGAALVAVHIDGAFRLVDPCRTLCNFFTLSREMTPADIAGDATPGEGMVVEILQGQAWHVGVVRSVQVDQGSMVVQTAKKGCRVVVSIGTHAWRRLGRDVSDTDRIVRPLLLQRNGKRGREEE